MNDFMKLQRLPTSPIGHTGRWGYFFVQTKGGQTISYQLLPARVLF